MLDRLLTTAQVGQLLGGMNPRDVLRLIHEGKLKAKLRPVHGEPARRPRKYVLASEVNRYLGSLIDFDPGAAAPAQPPRGPIAARKSPELVKELAAAKRYV